MALTASNMIELGTKAPDFNLPNTVNGSNVTLEDVQGKHATVVMFLCNHCPYVIHINEQLVHTAKKYTPLGVGFVAISSNDVVNYPADAPELMTIHAKELGYTFPYLYDESQEVAKAYDAACTPDIYVFDDEMHLAYRGRLDASRPNSGVPVTGEDLHQALDAILKKQKIAAPQYPSMGCNIKWKKTVN